ncbi:MAG: O-antigen ligase family protein [Marivibrio sp.]|uniref:O-antigen ligase family protein n=1 Tax=Marivibrio sp. TaxID=2039719 RepID=UPI0032ECCD2C
MPDANHRFAGACLAGLTAIGLPITLFFASQQTPVLLALLLAAAAGTIDAPACAWREEAARCVKTPVALALALFVVYAACSALWSPTPEATLARVPKLAALAALALAALALGRLMRHSTARGLGWAALIGLALLLGLIGLEAAFGLFREIEALSETPTDRANIANRAALGFAVLFWPLAALAGPKLSPPAAILLCAAGLAAAPFTGSLTAALALGGAAGVAVAHLLRPAAGGIALAALTILFGGGAALIGFNAEVFDAVAAWGFDEGLNSVAHRAGVWRTAAHLIEQAPWFGHGLDATRHLLPPDTPLGAVIELRTSIGEPHILYLSRTPALPLHPHSGWLQAGLEFGALGIVGLAFAAFSATLLLKGWPERGALAAIIVIGSVSVGLWQSWWLCLGVTAIFFGAAARAAAARRAEAAS